MGLADYPILTTDVLVIGSGGTGLRAAIEARRQGVDVLVAAKGHSPRGGATVTAPGDYAVNSATSIEIGLPGDRRDTCEKHAEDTFKGGKNIADPRLVAILAEDAPARFWELHEWGMKFTDLRQYAGHSYPRSCESGKVGQFGIRLMHVLEREARRAGARTVADLQILDLVIGDGRVIGALGYDGRRGTIVAVEARAVVLATGGGSRIFPHTSNPEEATGDGYSLAYRAGADLVDMELVQFIPVAQVWPPGLKGFDMFAGTAAFLLDSWYLNSLGQRFMEKWDPERKDHTTRDALSIGITMEILEGRGSAHGGVYLSLKHLPDNLLDAFAQKMFPNWVCQGIDLKRFGVDPKRDAFEIAPASHYFMGGVRIDESCATTVEGLFAGGEVTGRIQGANRLSGNAITETQVFGARAGRSAAAYAQSHQPTRANLAKPLSELDARLLGSQREDGIGAIEVRRKVQELAGEAVGPVRDGETLTMALDRIETIRSVDLPNLRVRCRERVCNREMLQALELFGMVDLLEMIVRSALARTESRGAHYRRDFPSIDDTNWRKSVVVVREGRQMMVCT